MVKVLAKTSQPILKFTSCTCLLHMPTVSLTARRGMFRAHDVAE